MSTDAAAGPATLPVLDVNERRVLGVLIEKAKTTPDAYPMSVNGLVTGCNQKSNRDPVLNLTDADVEEALARCQKKGLVFRLTGGGRVERWKHNLYESWTPDKVELAILAELLLRGPQTEGELRSRASRMEPIDDLDRLRSVLKPMVERKLITYLTPEDRRGAVLSHGFHDPGELEQLRQRAAGAAASPAASVPAGPAATVPRSDDRLVMVERELFELKRQVEDLRAVVHALREELGGGMRSSRDPQ
jgi:uncharacterized protein YceH (UPF0502 family)